MSDSVLSTRAANGSWSRNAALRIEYTAAVLEEIRRTIQEGFHKIPHGGVETGGLLYGKWEGELLTISAWRPIQCEHPLGPRFELSHGDEKELAVQLAEAVPELENFQPVGWFASHSRGALQLRGPDLDLHAKYFPEPWQPILLLCASRSQPMQAAFYTRLEGTLVAGLEVAPFEVVPNPTAVPRRERRAPQSGPRTDGIPERRDPRRERRRPAPQPGDGTNILATRLGPLPNAADAIAGPQGPEFVEHGSGTWSPIDPAVARGPWLARGYEQAGDDGNGAIHDSTIYAAQSPAVEGGIQADPTFDGEPLPKFLGPPLAERVFPWKGLALAAMWLTIAGAGIYIIPRLTLPVKPTLDLQASEVPSVARGQMMIRWKLKGSGTAAPKGAELHIADGVRERTFTLSPREWESGSITYWRQSKQMDVRLAVQVVGGEAVAGQTHFIGSEAEPLIPGSPDVAQLKNTLLNVRRQGRKLERLLAVQERKTRPR